MAVNDNDYGLIRLERGVCVADYILVVCNAMMAMLAHDSFIFGDSSHITLLEKSSSRGMSMSLKILPFKNSITMSR